MLTSLRLVNFKNFADETLKLGPFTVIVGANASGKSNIRDAFRFLHGIGRGYTLAEIMGGKLGPGGYVEWEPIPGRAQRDCAVLGKANPPYGRIRFEHRDAPKPKRIRFFRQRSASNPDDPDGFRWLSDHTVVNGQPAMGSLNLGSQWQFNSGISPTLSDAEFWGCVSV